MNGSHNSKNTTCNATSLVSLERQESTTKALRYLSRLPENQQEVIRLKFQHGLSYKQISSVTRLSVTNVGFLIHTGLKTLRHRMGAETPG